MSKPLEIKSKERLREYCLGVARCWEAATLFQGKGLWTWETSGAVLMWTVAGVTPPAGVRPAETELMLCLG